MTSERVVREDRPLHIWHVNIAPPQMGPPVDGLLLSMRRRATLEERLGHRVRTIARSDLDDGPWHRRLRGLSTMFMGPERPDVINFCSAYRPMHLVMALVAQRRGVPYVVTPASALAPAGIARDALRKKVFIRIFERPYLRRARAVICRTAVEERDVAQAAGHRLSLVTVPNAAPFEAYPRPLWPGLTEGRPLLVSLSRHDVYQKGLDILAEMAAELPGVDICVHGHVDANAPEITAALAESSVDTFTLGPAIFGAEKETVLLGAAMYVQMSRFESLSNSVLEAMAVGLPVAVSSYIAEEMELVDGYTALVLGNDAAVNAAKIRAGLADPAALSELASRGRDHILHRYAPETVTAKMIETYRAALRPLVRKAHV